MDSLYKLIVFDRTEKFDELNDNMDTNNNVLSFTEVMERNGLKETLEKLQLIKNKNIVKKAQRIYDALYNNLEEENNDTI